jgi:hypothetical protein
LDIQQAKADLATIEQDPSLEDHLNLAARVRALAQLEFIDEFARLRPPPAERAALGRRVDRARVRLERANRRLFEEAWARLQAVGRGSGGVGNPPYDGARPDGDDGNPPERGARPDGGHKAPPSQARQELRAWLDQFTAYQPRQARTLHVGYDALDALIDGALNLDVIPAPTHKPERGMIHLEPSPARVVLEMVDRVQWHPQDLFYDVGSGLGQVPILVHLLTGVRATGIEVEPAYCRVARATAEALGLSQVSFVQADARAADYRPGTVFYLFTPFVGEMLHAVLDRLRSQAAVSPRAAAQTRRAAASPQQPAITVCSFGPCTPLVARQDWLRSEDADLEHEFKLALFRSTL